MTKIFSIVLLAASFSSFAQVKLSAKTNLLFKTDKPTWESIKGSAVTAYNESGKNNVGLERRSFCESKFTCLIIFDA